MLAVAAVAGDGKTVSGRRPQAAVQMPPRELSSEDKARLSWHAKASPREEKSDKPPVLEDMMSRDEIIEEFDVFGEGGAVANRIPGPPVERTLVLPVPRMMPAAPGVLQFRPIRRIRQLVREDLFPYFDLYIYVNKAPKGVWAQQMFVYQRQPDGKFRPLFHWLASTGRERNERYFTTTPVGIFELDPNRFHKITYSAQWGGVAMPFAMFLDFSYSDRKSGVAIHGTHGETDDYLGRRASGGCIRLSVSNARMLFYLIRSQYAGMVPKFRYKGELGHTSLTGELLRGRNGNVAMKPGYRVLVIVDYVTK